jgi:hypothetical protein
MTVYTQYRISGSTAPKAARDIRFGSTRPSTAPRNARDPDCKRTQRRSTRRRADRTLDCTARAVRGSRNVLVLFITSQRGKTSTGSERLGSEAEILEARAAADGGLSRELYFEVESLIRGWRARSPYTNRQRAAHYFFRSFQKKVMLFDALQI